MYYSITQPFSPAGHEARWMTPFTMYPTVADEGYSLYSPTLSTASVATSKMTAMFLRGDGLGTFQYNYAVSGGATTWDATGSTSVDLGRASALFYERPCGIGCRIKYIDSVSTYDARVVIMPLPPGQANPGNIAASLPVNPLLPLTSSQKKWGAREMMIANGDSAYIFCMPCDSRALDLLPGNAARTVSGWNNYAILVAVEGSYSPQLEVEVIFRYEGIDLIGGSSTASTDGNIKRTSSGTFQKVVNGVIDVVEKGWNFVKEHEGVIKKGIEVGKTVWKWLSAAALSPQNSQTFLLKTVMNYDIETQNLPILSSTSCPSSRSASSSAGAHEEKQPEKRNPPSTKVNEIEDEPIMLTPRQARKPSLALSLR